MLLWRVVYRGTALAELSESAGLKGIRGKVGYLSDYEFIATT
jgi:hypothetical protein